VGSKIQSKECVRSELRKRGDGGFVESQLQPRPDPELVLGEADPCNVAILLGKAAEAGKAGKSRCTAG
jgi:hypothetical protein